MLKQASDEFIQALEQKPILQPLYKNRHIVVEIKSQSETAWIAFTQGTVEQLNEKPDNVTMTVSGHFDVLQQCISGQEPLLSFEERKQLETSGKMEHLLALESLLLLTGGISDLFHYHT